MNRSVKMKGKVDLIEKKIWQKGSSQSTTSFWIKNIPGCIIFLSSWVMDNNTPSSIISEDWFETPTLLV